MMCAGVPCACASQLQFQALCNPAFAPWRLQHACVCVCLVCSLFASRMQLHGRLLASSAASRLQIACLLPPAQLFDKFYFRKIDSSSKLVEKGGIFFNFGNSSPSASPHLLSSFHLITRSNGTLILYFQYCIALYQFQTSRFSM